MKALLSVAGALAIVACSTAAFADSGDGPQFALPQPVPATGPATTVMTAAPLATDVGNERPAVFAGQPAEIAQNTDGLLPTNGNEGMVQSANSAPRGFYDGTLPMLTAQAAHPSVSRTLAQR
ncbi:MAG TPA: hypothetical protein VKI44_38305 [Acetobacteraceae bacterium]|nr:hypothetical protein [Acetobacteraceae bacterium]